MECEFKFIQQWRSKLLFHIEQQLNISKTLWSTFPNKSWWNAENVPTG